MAELHGTCDRRFVAVREALAAFLDGEDVGASAAVYFDGEPVVDLWGGHTDAARGLGYLVNGRTCMWGGRGGSLVLVDFDARMAVAYAMNQMIDRGVTGDQRGIGIVLAAYDGLGR